jgi:uncharacterized protein
MGNWPIRKLIAVAISVLITALFVFVFVGIKNAKAVPIERNASVSIARLPNNTPPFQVALLSDIHLGNRGMEPNRLAKIVDQVNKSRPDLILLAGDFVAGESEVRGVEIASKMTAPLSRLNARFGVFAVLGNHDNWTAPDAIRTALKKAGIVVLENEAVRRGPFAVVGVGDRFSGHDDITRSALAADHVGGVPIVFTHSPDIAASLPDHFSLLLAGHTHCGQIVLPWLGPIVRYSRWKRLYDLKYQCGRIDDPNRVTFVTAGLGGTVPVRINAMPDWWLISIKP